jgi:signal transduction histidine kinase
LNDFLSIGKLEEGKTKCIPVLMDYPAFCKAIIEEVRGLCKEGQVIHFEQAGKSDVWLDKQLLRNVLLNLLSNAIKYSGDNTDIFFRAKTIAQFVHFDVEDQGIGIPESDQQYIFDRFFRANNAGTAQGTGLGLNIVKGYVELMGGVVTLTSKLGQGTIVHVALPNVRVQENVLPKDG